MERFHCSAMTILIPIFSSHIMYILCMYVHLYGVNKNRIWYTEYLNDKSRMISAMFCVFCVLCVVCSVLCFVCCVFCFVCCVLCVVCSVLCFVCCVLCFVCCVLCVVCQWRTGICTRDSSTTCTADISRPHPLNTLYSCPNLQ